MFNFFKKKKNLSYEEFGYMYADSLEPLFSVFQTGDWLGRAIDPERMGRDLTVFSMAIFQFSTCDRDLIPPEGDALMRATSGFMSKLTERYPSLAYDTDISADCIAYINALAADFQNKSKSESFPSLAPLATTKITGLKMGDDNWSIAYEAIYSFMENSSSNLTRCTYRVEEARKACLRKISKGGFCPPKY